MAESMTRRDALLEAWAEYWMDGDDDEGPVIAPPNYYFEAGFNAAWDALLAEIREVETKAEEEWKANGLETICSLDCLIDMRLRERLRDLVREGE